MRKVTEEKNRKRDEGVKEVSESMMEKKRSGAKIKDEAKSRKKREEEGRELRRGGGEGRRRGKVTFVKPVPLSMTRALQR